MYKRKTYDEWVVQGNYGYGWDDENAELTYKAGKQSLKEYRENGSGCYRLVKRRIKIEEKEGV